MKSSGRASKASQGFDPSLRRPIFKSHARQLRGETIVLTREPGVESTIPDPDGRVGELLDLLDGQRTAGEIAEVIGAGRPELTPEAVAEGIAALDAAELLEDAAAATSLTERERERYQSNLEFFGTFAGFGRSRYSFQERLRQSHVLLLGVGGIGSTVLYNLAGLGVGRVTVVDSDAVELGNLSRQFLYGEQDVGRPKLARAAARIESLNRGVSLMPVERRILRSADVADLLDGVDLVVSAIDRPEGVQYQVNDACVEAGVPWVNGAVWASRGYYYSVLPGQSGCLRCHGVIREREEGLNVSEWPELVNGATGPTATLISSLVSLEALRYLTGFAPPVAAARVWVADFAEGGVAVGYEWPRLPECGVCN